MAFKPLPILLFLALLVQISFAQSDVATIVCPLPRPAKSGPWMVIKDLKAPEVQDLARFAITEHNKKDRVKLELLSVDEGQTQVADETHPVDGTNYFLSLRAKALSVHHYGAFVLVKPPNLRNLIGFTVSVGDCEKR